MKFETIPGNIEPEPFPIKAVNGNVIVEELPFRPSKILECITHDKADRTESMVVAIDTVRYGRKFDKKKGWEHNGTTFPQDLKVGDRVIHKGTYQDDDCFSVNGKKYRSFSPWEIVAVIEKPQPEGYEDLKTGEMLPDKHPLLIH